MYSKIIDAYIRDHKSSYQPKYCYHSCDRLDERTYKFRYYIRDPQLIQMDIFLTLHLEDEVEVSMPEDLIDQEEWALACDALERVRGYTNRKTTLAPEDMDGFIASPEISDRLTVQDMINILNHLAYHQGKNPDSIYAFYAIYIPYLKDRLAQKRYQEVLQSVELLLNEILYEVYWYGINVRYLDQEHLMHQAYLRSIFHQFDLYFDDLISADEDALLGILDHVFSYWRCAFSIYTSLEKLAVDHPEQMRRLLSKMAVPNANMEGRGKYLCYSLLMSFLDHKDGAYKKAMKEIIKLLMNDIITLANPEEQRETGMVFLSEVGYDILLDIFEETKNSYIYQCFDIDKFPPDLKKRIRAQLEDAVKYYADMMSNENLRIAALDQISNINTLLMEKLS